MYRFEPELWKARLSKLTADKRREFAFKTAERLLSLHPNKRTLLDVLEWLEKNEETKDEDVLSAGIYALRTYEKQDNLVDAFYTAQCAYNNVEYLAQQETGAEFDKDGLERILQSSIVQEELAAQDKLLSELESNN